MDMMKLFALAKELWGLFNRPLFILCTGATLFLSSCKIDQQQSLLSAKTSSGDTVKKVLESVPFAYDVAIDTISYNSCVGGDLNSSGKLHGIKFGANEGFVDTTASGAVKGGLKLRSDFLQYIAKYVDPTYPNTTISPSQIQYILENSETNKGLKIQYAVRYTSNLQVVVDVISPQPPDPAAPIVLNRDAIYEGGVLSYEPIVSAITKSVLFGPDKSVLSEGPRIYNLGSKSSPDPLEGSLGFSLAYDESAAPVAGADDGVGVGEQYSDQIRGQFNSFKYILAVTFGNETLQSSFDTTPSQGFNSLKRPKETDLTKAYGKGYELTFSSKNSALSSWRKNLLTKVNEKNLEDGRLISGSSWTCDNIVIMKTNQFNNKKANEPACAELTANDMLNTSVAAKVKMLRRHYTEDLWGVGLFYSANELYDPNNRLQLNASGIPQRPLCLVNKQKECYLPTTNIISTNPAEDIGVQYDSSKECYLSRASYMGVSYVGNLTGDAARRLGRCAQYASICIRSSTSY